MVYDLLYVYVDRIINIMRPSRTKPKLKPRTDKIVEALLHLISRAEEQNKKVTQFDLVKSFFFADTAHIEEYGRPVTYDNYVAMKHGPVASVAYDMLKSNAYKNEIEGWPLWFKSPSGNANSYHTPKRAPNYKKLSKTDLAKLNEAQDMVWNLGFGAASDLSHEHPAYTEVWKKGRTEGSEDMDYMSLMPKGSKDRFSLIKFASENR